MSQDSLNLVFHCHRLYGFLASAGPHSEEKLMILRDSIPADGRSFS
jgi:hypothetical protein